MLRYSGAQVKFSVTSPLVTSSQMIFYKQNLVIHVLHFTHMFVHEKTRRSPKICNIGCSIFRRSPELMS